MAPSAPITELLLDWHQAKGWPLRELTKSHAG
jgi:hypothetical protein